MKIEQKAKVSRKLREEGKKKAKYLTYTKLRGRLYGGWDGLCVKGIDFYDAVSIGDEVTITVEVKS